MKSYPLPPDSFFIGTLEIKFYGVIMALSMLFGVLLACKLAKKHNIKSDDIFLLALIVLPCAVVGARLYYCIFYEHDYTFLELFNLRQGGLAIYGGVIGRILGIIIFALIKKDIKIVFKLLDVCAPCLILGQALGRWGNFFNQEAYGNLVTNQNLQWFPYAVFIEDENAWFQATFFYESILKEAKFDNYYIKLLGSCDTFRITANDLLNNGGKNLYTFIDYELDWNKGVFASEK